MLHGLGIDSVAPSPWDGYRLATEPGFAPGSGRTGAWAELHPTHSLEKQPNMNPKWGRPRVPKCNNCVAQVMNTEALDKESTFEADVIVLACKAWEVERCLSMCKPWCGEKTLVSWRMLEVSRGNVCTSVPWMYQECTLDVPLYAPC